MILDHLFTRTLFESQTDHITQFASNAHEEWRRNFDPTGTKPRIKKNSDGTEGDINVPFADLHPDWQKENLAAAHAAHRAVKHFGRDMEKAAEYVHNEWMKRNPKADYNAAQHVPYDNLPQDEKEKDRVHVRTMMQLMGHHPEQGVAEVAPPGAKAERMVRHIKQGYAQDGKLTPREKGIAFATAWKAHNAGRVEEQGVAEGSSYNIDQDDHDEFTPHELVRIKNSHFPDTLRDNLRAAKKEARRAKHFSSSSDGGDSKLGSPVGSASDNTYEGVAEGSFDHWSPMGKDSIHQDRIRSLQNLIAIAKEQGRQLRVQELELALKKLQGVAEGAELKQAKRKYNQAAKDANADQVGAGKKIDTMKNSLRQKDVDNKKQDVEEGAELKKAKRSMNQAAKDANTDQVGAGKKIDTMKNSLRQKDVDNKKQDVEEGILGSDPNRGQKVPGWAKGGIIGKIGRKLDPAWSDIQMTVPQHLLSKQSSVPDKKSLATKDMPKAKATSITPTRAIPKRAGTNPSHPVTKNVVKTIADKSGVAESNTLMKKLHQALLKEGRVKELALDLKTLNDAEFMKKYGKAKAAIRRDMKKVDEGNANSGRRGPNSPPDNTPVKLGRVQKLKTGIKHHADSSRYGGTVPDTDDDHLLSPASRHRLHKAVTPDHDMDEARMSAAQRLSNAWDKQRAKSNASLARTPSSIPKKQEPEPQEKQVAKKIDESRRDRQALMAQIVNSR